MSENKQLGTDSSNGKEDSAGFRPPAWPWMLGFGLAFAVMYTCGYLMSSLRSQPYQLENRITSNSAPAIAAAQSGDVFHKLSQGQATMGQLAIGSPNATNNDSGYGMSCVIQPVTQSCLATRGNMCHADLEMANTAWQYFENNRRSKQV